MIPFSDVFHYLRVYRSYLGRRLYIVFVLTASTAFASGFGITLLLPLLKASDTEGGGTDGKLALLNDFLHWIGVGDSVVGILIFIAVVFVAKGLLKFAERGYRGYLRARLLRELKLGLYRVYSGMDYRYYIRRNTGHFINVINQQVERFLNSFDKFTMFLAKGVTTVTYLAFAFVLTWQFSLAAVGVGFIILILFKYLNAYVRELSRYTSQEMSRLNKLLVQSLQGFKYILSTGQMQHLQSGITSSVERLSGYTLRQKAASAFTTAIREPVSVLFIVAIIAIQVTVMDQPVAPIFVALLLFKRSMNSIITVQEQWQKTMDRIGSLEMVDDEFAEVGSYQEQNGTRRLGALSEGITFEDVHFAYDAGDEDALRDVSVEIPANTTVAFVGESGAGKSTLVDMLTLMLKPRAGEVRIDGVPGREIDVASWRPQIGYVSQETVVFDDTVANNISLWSGDYDEDEAFRERVRDAAEKAYAADFIEGLPDGYQTVVGDRGMRLSGGQRQRLFVARELFKQPNLLILDEATSALDTESERYIQSSIDALKGEVTVVIIAHRLSTVKNVDRLYVMDEGRVIEQGGYRELAEQDESRFQEMVEMQSL